MIPKKGETYLCTQGHLNHTTKGKRYVVTRDSSLEYIYVIRDDTGVEGGYMISCFTKVEPDLTVRRFYVQGARGNADYHVTGTGDTVECAIEDALKGRFEKIEELIWYVYELQYKESVKVEYKKTKTYPKDFHTPTQAIVSKVEI